MCPSGKNDDEVFMDCEDSINRMINAYIDGKEDVVKDIDTLMNIDEKKYGEGCAGAHEMLSDINLDSDEVKDAIGCLMDSCGCNNALFLKYQTEVSFAGKGLAGLLKKLGKKAI